MILGWSYCWDGVGNFLVGLGIEVVCCRYGVGDIESEIEMKLLVFRCIIFGCIWFKWVGYFRSV